MNGKDYWKQEENKMDDICKCPKVNFKFETDMYKTSDNVSDLLGYSQEDYSNEGITRLMFISKIIAELELTKLRLINLMIDAHKTKEPNGGK